MITDEREPMTHEIVQSVKTLTARLARHKANNERAKAERRVNEVVVLAEVLKDISPDLFDALGQDRLTIMEHVSVKLCLARVNGVVCFSYSEPVARVTVGAVLADFTLDEVISGLVNALAKRIDNKHEAGRKLARVNRRLRGILNILDNS